MNDAICITPGQIEEMLIYFALKMGRDITDGKAEARVQKDGKTKVKISFLIAEKPDLKSCQTDETIGN